MRLRFFDPAVIAMAALALCSSPSLSASSEIREAKDDASVQSLQARAEAGDAKAELKLGWAYFTGRGASKDQSKAKLWLTKAAAQGSVRAQYDLGLIALDEKDTESTYKLWLKAAEGDDADACCGLAHCYHNGWGTAINYEQAFKWFLRGAKLGNIQSMNCVGELYQNGKGVWADLGAGFEWYRKAADKDDPTGTFNVGYCYSAGKGITQDYAEANRWFFKAATNGLAEAQNALGWDYFKGLGCERDYKKAAYWFELGAKNGNVRAKNNLAALKEASQNPDGRAKRLGYLRNLIAELIFERVQIDAAARGEEIPTIAQIAGRISAPLLESLVDRMNPKALDGDEEANVYNAKLAIEALRLASLEAMRQQQNDAKQMLDNQYEVIQQIKNMQIK